MRIIVTGKTHFQSKYFKDENISNDVDMKEKSMAAIVEKVKEAVAAGENSFVLAGGEPLIRDDIVKLVKRIKKVEGVESIELETDGILLGDKARDLAAAGLTNVQIDICTLRPLRYFEMTDGIENTNLVAGINAATDAGLKPVKLIVPLIKGYNDDELMDFLQLTLQHQYQIIFVQKPLSEEVAADGYACMSAEEIKAKLPALRPVGTGEEQGEDMLFSYPGAMGKMSFRG